MVPRPCIAVGKAVSASCGGLQIAANDWILSGTMVLLAREQHFSYTHRDNDR